MKVFLKLRTWVVLILSCFLAVAVISGCEEDSGGSGSGTPREPGDERNDNGETERKRIVFAFES